MRISMMFKQIHCKLQRECVKSSWLFLRYVIWCRFGWKDSVVAHLWDIWVFSCGFLWTFVLASHAAQISETTLLGNGIASHKLLLLSTDYWCDQAKAKIKQINRNCFTYIWIIESIAVREILLLRWVWFKTNISKRTQHRCFTTKGPRWIRVK